MNFVCQWKVSYENIQWKLNHYPFFKNSSIVTAPNRKAAIEQIAANFPPPAYGNYKASRVKGAV
jgi:hypothetical protein